MASRLSTTRVSGLMDNPIDSMRKQFEQAHGEPSDPDSEGDED
jgi:hypothetical protein